MLTATEEKISGSEKKKVNNNMYDIFSIKSVAMQEFLDDSRCSRAKPRHRNVQKIVCRTCKVVFFFWLIRPIVVFHGSRHLRRLALHDFIFSLSKL